MLIQDPHIQFCCAVHGCRFGNIAACTVVRRQAIQANKCGESSICSEYRYKSNGNHYAISY